MQRAPIHGETAPEETNTEHSEHAPFDGARLRMRLAWVLSAVLLILLLVFIPPLLNVSRFQRRIASNLSAALGRPVHLDRVRLTLLPLPGFTLENFVVDEDPAFGYEPILRASEVRATVRLSSLWSRRVEFSRIVLTETTSLNLVRLPDGRWNFEPILIQASRVEAAPTSQPYSGPTPRFPYVEASGARLNFKVGDEKLPLAFTDSEFALWLPDAREWHFRLQAHPARTDVAPADTGLLRLEGILGSSTTPAASLAEVPIDLRADWQAAPLAGLTRLAFGRDAGLRGNVTLSLHASGTAGNAAFAADLKFAQLRRSDFIPPRLLGFEVGCQGAVTNTLQSLSRIECHWPPAESSDRAVLIATGSIAELRNPHTAALDLTVPSLPASTLLDWLQAATPHPPSGFSGSGVLAGTLSWNPASVTLQPRQPVWAGDLELSGESLDLPSSSGFSPVPLGDIMLRSTPVLASTPAHSRGRSGALSQNESSGPSFELLPVTLPLGARQPALLEGHFDISGYTLHLTGGAELERLLALAGAVPQFGEGLADILARDHSQPAASNGAAPVRLDLTAIRHWGHPQIWFRTGSQPFSQPDRRPGAALPIP